MYVTLQLTANLLAVAILFSILLSIASLMSVRRDCSCALSSFFGAPLLYGLDQKEPA